jgi:hypothetical protein
MAISHHGKARGHSVSGPSTPRILDHRMNPRHTSTGRLLTRTGLFLLLGLGGPALAWTGCGWDASVGEPEVALEARHTPVHVDSTFPIEEEIRRFREGLTRPSGLTGGADSMDELVEGLIRSLEAADTLAIAELGLSRTEFAWHYYPYTQYVERPYELPPGLVWFQLQNRSSQGLTRLLRAYAGRTLYYTGYRCPDEGEVFGEGHIWHACTLLGELPTGEKVEERLFGSILALDGRYKLVSFSNEL